MPKRAVLEVSFSGSTTIQTNAVHGFDRLSTTKADWGTHRNIQTAKLAPANNPTANTTNTQ